MPVMIAATSPVCTPRACTVGQVAHEYASPGFAVGLVIIVLSVLLVRRLVRGRR